MFRNSFLYHFASSVTFGGDFANTTWSSAKRIRNNFNSLMVNTPFRSALILLTMSLTNSINNNGELGSPCFRPIWEEKNCEKADLYRMQSFTVVYIAFIAFTNLQLMFSNKSLCHK